MHSRGTLLLAIGLMLTSCAAANRPATPWKLELATSGGFSGRGNGTIALGSDGSIAVTTMERKSCTLKATPEELRRFTTLLAATKPDTWKDSYTPQNPCCDRFQYDLTLTEGKTEKKVTWVDDPLPMPADLSALAEALMAQLRASADQCRKQ